MNRLPKGIRGQVGISFGTLQSGIRAICRATSKGYTIKLLPTSFQRGSKGGKRRHRGLARRGVAVRRCAVLMLPKGQASTATPTGAAAAFMTQSSESSVDDLAE